MKSRKMVALLVCLLIMSLAVTACGGQKAAPIEKTIKIGIIQPMSGTSALTGQDTYEGIKLAIKEAEAAGGLPGKLEFVGPVDDRSIPSDGVSAAQKLIKNDNVSAIIGPFNSSVALPVKDFCFKEKVPMLTTGSGADALTAADYDYVFRAHMYNELQSKMFAKFVGKDFGMKNVVILYENTDWGKGLDTNMNKMLEKFGTKVIAHESYNPGTVDYLAPLTRIKKLNPDAIIAFSLVTEAPIIARQAKDAGIDTSKIFGMGGWDQPDMPKLTKGAEEGIKFILWFNPESNPEARKFAENFKKEYGKESNTWSAQGYTITSILIDAIKRAGSGDREAIRKALEETQGLKLPTGTVDFDEKHESPTMLFMAQWKNGVKELVDVDPVYSE